MQVGSICSRHVVTIDAQRSLTEAARLMRDEHVGNLVVTCSTGCGTEVCGIVTDRDLVVDALARDPMEIDAQVADLAHTELATITESAGLDDAIAKMHEKGVGRLLVSDSEDRLCGVLSIDDVVQAFTEQIGNLAKVIRSARLHEQSSFAAAPASHHQPRFPSMGTAAQFSR